MCCTCNGYMYKCIAPSIIKYIFNIYNSLRLCFFFRSEQIHSQEHVSTVQHQPSQYAVQSQKTQHAPIASNNNGNQEKMLSVSGKKKCSHCGEELGN